MPHCGIVLGEIPSKLRPPCVKKWPERTLSRKNGLDAIHDTVHEMARDEARHGRGLEGLLKRYFK